MKGIEKKFKIFNVLGSFKPELTYRKVVQEEEVAIDTNEAIQYIMEKYDALHSLHTQRHAIEFKDACIDLVAQYMPKVQPGMVVRTFDLETKGKWNGKYPSLDMQYSISPNLEEHLHMFYNSDNENSRFMDALYAPGTIFRSEKMDVDPNQEYCAYVRSQHTVGPTRMIEKKVGGVMLRTFDNTGDREQIHTSYGYVPQSVGRKLFKGKGERFIENAVKNSKKKD